KKLSKNLIDKAMTVKNTIKLNKIVDRLNQEQGPSGLKLVRIPAIFFYRHIIKKIKAVFIYRNPADVRASLLRRGISSFEPDWFENNNALIAAHENIEDSILISYESLLKGEAGVGEAFASLGLKVNFDIIEKDQRTQKHSQIVLTDREQRLYERLQELEG
ncbi:MAG: hypothetical protein ACOCZ3_03570, partial [Bacillota bacterium]